MAMLARVIAEDVTLRFEEFLGRLVPLALRRIEHLFRIFLTDDRWNRVSSDDNFACLVKLTMDLKDANNPTATTEGYLLGSNLVGKCRVRH